MKLEFEEITVWRAYDQYNDVECGMFTTEEEAFDAIERINIPYLYKVINEIQIKVPKNNHVEEEKLEVKQGDIYYVMVIEIRGKYNTLILPDNEFLGESAYHLDDNTKDYDSVEDMVSMYQKEFNAVEVITMQQYIDEVGNQND